jgi:acyl-CoA thioester hydrolase
VYARAASGIVLVDASTMRPRRMTDRERDAWAPYVDEPVVFARR